MSGLVRHGLWLLLPILAAALVVSDPWLSLRLGLPDLLEVLHYRLLPLLLGLGLFLTVALWLMAKAGDFATGVIVLVVGASQLNGIGAGPIDLFDVALLGSAAVWAARIAPDADRTLRLSPLFFLASALALLAFAHLPVMRPVPWFIGLFGISRVVLLSLILVDICRTAEQLEQIARALVWVAVASAVVGICQFLLAYFDIFAFTLIEPAISAYKPTPLGFVLRASGFCSTAQHFSSFMICALPFALWQATHGWRMWNVAAVPIIFGGLLVSLNFGGIFAGALILVLFPFFRWPRLAIHLALFGLSLLALAYFTGLLQLAYDLSFGDAGVAKGLDQRKTLFSLGLTEVARSPLIGTGLRGFSEVDGNFWHRPVHNLFGQAATELGLLGALVFIFIFFMLTLDLVKLMPSAVTRSPYPRLLLLTLVALLFLAQSEPNLEQSNLWLMLGFAQAAILTLRPRWPARVR